ncbi:MAG: Alpha-maltose-1-phosphate synthase [Nitrosomonadaceae bacterium]|nr:Alpha-maltose-1-phosphate synthase [Nitrosomonadaceae bacterium]
MRVAFDQQVFLLQEYGGISRYVCSLANGLTKIPDVDVTIIAPLHYNGHLAELSRDLKWGWRVPRLPKTARLAYSVSAALAQQAMRRFRPDVVHETYYSANAFAPSGALRVITVYDMIHERFPSEFSGGQLTAAKKIAVSRADHVLCISESTRRDLIDIFGVDAGRVSVVYLGYDELRLAILSSDEPRLRTDTGPFLLHVGSRGGYKNFASVLRTFAHSSCLKESFSIVCFGGGAFRSEELSLMRELKLADGQVQHLGGGDEVLAWLYQQAAAFIYPSRYEGFGIPLLEAMSLGCPVICSNTSSIPEVVGAAGEYFDPGDIESMRTAIEFVLGSRTRRDELVAKGYARCALFSWTRCAEETLNIYRSLL